MATELTLDFAGLRVIFTAASTDEAWGAGPTTLRAPERPRRTTLLISI